MSGEAARCTDRSLCGDTVEQENILDLDSDDLDSWATNVETVD